MDPVVRYAEFLDVATSFIVLICLWIRRATWHYKWEKAKTIGLTLMLIGGVLKAPPISWLLDRDVLHGLYLLIANAFIVSGIAAFAYSAECKLRSDREIRRWRVTAVVIPLTIGISTMVGLFATGAWSTLDSAYGLPVHTMAYWLVYDVTIIYFCVLWAYALGYLFYDPPSRRAAGVYLCAIGVALIGATCRALLVTEGDNLPDAFLTDAANTANSLAVIIFAVGAAHMWRRRLRTVNTRPYGQKQDGVRRIT